MKLLVLLALVGATAAFSVNKYAAELTGGALSDYVNHAQKLFKTEVPKVSYRNRLMAAEHAGQPADANYKADAAISVALPASFDSRTQWPACTGIGYIRDQSDCGSCWAFGAAEAMSDRVCIATKGAQQPILSADDLLSCCGLSCGIGCNGGFNLRAWTYIVQHGICTGGGFYDNIGCKPYPFEPCGHHTVDGVAHYRNCSGVPDPATPKCEAHCTNAAYTKPYADDKFFAKSAYAVKQDVDAIKQEILTNGPVEAGFKVYEDFDQYKGGIYQHTGGKLLGGHAVKVIGWGEENGTPYWLAANQWAVEWGEQGFFRIILGQNECGFEAGIVAGLPMV